MGSCIQKEEGREEPLVSVLGTPMEACVGINLIKTGLLNTTKLQSTIIFQHTGSRSKDTAQPLLSLPCHPSSSPQPLTGPDGKLTLQTREVTLNPSLHPTGVSRMSKLNR